ncbi:flagellar motor switch protein FliG [Clostridium sp. 'deep sea']|uniref:flagellar motor switch protein FliG n=1 Tax=Clostridium sp. 'deep sea' TaxID=2779445 RepID=UPI0018968410|nr:flagellar motor switch protein FliG [Clostridium sp. 'deep sea']QOR35345.1 flagellar motor switch protein FliG [Clostridium sp. 'deep sea']
MAGLTPDQKAAILLLSLDKSTSAEVLKYLNEEHIQRVAFRMAESKAVSQNLRSTVLDEFYQLCLEQGFSIGGGLEYAKELLTEALGQDRCSEIISKMSTFIKSKPFDFLKKVDPNEIIDFLKAERNQTVALILSFIDSAQGSVILSSFDEERQADIIIRVAKMSKISPEIVKDVEREVKNKISNFLGETTSTDIVGINIAADILSSIDRGTKVNIFDRVEETNQELAEELKKRMFLFEDIVSLDPRHAQIVLSRVPNSDLAMALKSTSDRMKNFVFKNISARAKEIINQEMDMMGRIRLSEVLEAQQKIVGIVHELEQNQEIVISKDSSDKLVG